MCVMQCMLIIVKHVGTNYYILKGFYYLLTYGPYCHQCYRSVKSHPTCNHLYSYAGLSLRQKRSRIATNRKIDGFLLKSQTVPSVRSCFVWFRGDLRTFLLSKTFVVWSRLSNSNLYLN